MNREPFRHRYHAAMWRLTRILGLAALALLPSATGCASLPGPYEPAQVVWPDGVEPTTPEGEPQIERGEAWGVMDEVISWTLGLPSKVFALDPRADNHQVSPEVEEAIQRYIDVNGLTDLKVRINQYDPAGEWQRLFRNEKMALPLRLTFGVISVLADTIFPGRIFGGDRYNPYTDTVSIYSDLRSWAWQELAGAKQYAESNYRWFKALSAALPFGQGIQEYRATTDAVRFAWHHGSYEEVQECTRAIFPAYGTYFSGWGRTIAIPPTIPWGPIVATGVLLVPGHLVGRIQAAHPSWEEARRDQDSGEPRRRKLWPEKKEPGETPPDLTRNGSGRSEQPQRNVRNNLLAQGESR